MMLNMKNRVIKSEAVFAEWELLFYNDDTDRWKNYPRDLINSDAVSDMAPHSSVITEYLDR
jgi:hypothetical protein